MNQSDKSSITNVGLGNMKIQPEFSRYGVLFALWLDSQIIKLSIAKHRQF